MAEGLTPKQRDILTFINDSTTKVGFPPTIRSLGEHFGIRSTNGVNDHLNALQRKGYLDRYANTSRGMALTSKALEELGVPDSLMQAAHKALVALCVVAAKPLGERVDREVQAAIAALRKAGVQ